MKADVVLTDVAVRVQAQQLALASESVVDPGAVRVALAHVGAFGVDEPGDRLVVSPSDSYPGGVWLPAGIVLQGTDAAPLFLVNLDPATPGKATQVPGNHMRLLDMLNGLRLKVRDQQQEIDALNGRLAELWKLVKGGSKGSP